MAIPKVKINWKTGTVLLLAVALVGVSVYLGWQYFRSQELLKNPTAAAIQETNDLLRQVGKHVTLPAGESPTVATVSDKSKLAGQPFFNRAEEGDKVLIFVKEGRAILFRPKINRVVEMTNMIQPTPTTVMQLSEATLAIYNGTKTQGLATVAENRLKDYKALKVVTKGNSVGEYKNSLIILLNPQAQNLAKELVVKTGASVREVLPSNEVKPGADVLLILGEDFK